MCCLDAKLICCVAAGYEKYYSKNRPSRSTAQGKDGKGTPAHSAATVSSRTIRLTGYCVAGKSSKEGASKDNGPKLNFAGLTSGKAGQPQQMRAFQQATVFAMILGAMAFFSSWGRGDAQEISFQHFKTQLLAKGIVEKVEVSNKTLAKVHIRASGIPRSAFSLSSATTNPHCATCLPAALQSMLAKLWAFCTFVSSFS